MAVHIKLIKNNIKRRSSYGKYFAKSVSQGEVTLDEIAAEACRNSGFSEGAVVGVVTELQELLKDKLSNGQTVVLPGIGRFSLHVKSIGVDDPKEFNLGRHITPLRLWFPASRPPHSGPPHPLRLQRWCQSRLAERLQAISEAKNRSKLFRNNIICYNSKKLYAK